MAFSRDLFKTFVILSELERHELMLAHARALRYLRLTTDPFDATEESFMQRFRLPQLEVLRLIDILEPHDDESFSNIPFTLQVLTALYLFATGSYQIVIGDNRRINLSQPSVSRFIYKIACLITTHLKDYVKFPVEQSSIAEKKDGFLLYGMPDVIAIVDGTHIPIRKPPKNDVVHHPRHFRNRKRFYSINVEAVCDSNGQWLAVNAMYPGSCHDSGIWACSPVRNYLQQHWSEENPMYILADHGYPAENWLFTPYRNPVQPYELNYNRRLVKTRKMIEQNFGVLKSTFRCISSDGKLRYIPTRAVNIIYSCFILYNYLKFHDMPLVMNPAEQHQPMDSDDDEDENQQHSQAINIRNTYAQRIL